MDERTNFDLEMLKQQEVVVELKIIQDTYLEENLVNLLQLYMNIFLKTLLFIDESHITCSQIAGMYKGDFSRKSTLSQYGFRLPSCVDNRPLKREEWDLMRPQTVFVSATPGEYELNKTGGIFVEQVIRPTGLIDPPIEIFQLNIK